MVEQHTPEEVQARLAQVGAALGYTQEQVAAAFGVNPRTVRRRLKLLPGGRVPLPTNVIGSGGEWSLAAEAVRPQKCPRCGEIEPGEYCLACNHYEGADEVLADQLRIERQRMKRAAKHKFRPKGAEAGAVA
jgi:hypothetical protein